MLVSSAAGFRFIGNNRIISFVVIKYKKIFSHAATKKKPTEKIIRKDISFLFSFLNHYLKKIKCSATGKPRAIII